MVLILIIYMDRLNRKIEWFKYMARIPDNYYAAIADDLTDEEAQVKIKELRKLCDSVTATSVAFPALHCGK